MPQQGSNVPPNPAQAKKLTNKKKFEKDASFKLHTSCEFNSR